MREEFLFNPLIFTPFISKPDADKDDSEDFADEIEHSTDEIEHSTDEIEDSTPTSLPTRRHLGPLATDNRGRVKTPQTMVQVL